MSEPNDMAAREKSFLDDPKQGPLDEGDVKRPAHVEPDELPTFDPVADPASQPVT